MHTHVKTAPDGMPTCQVHHGHNGSHGESTPGHAHDGLAPFQPETEAANATLHIAAPALLAALEDAVRMLKAWDKEYGSQATDIANLTAVIKTAKGQS